MLAAIETVQRDVSSNVGADTHRVPRSTLKDHVSGKIIHGPTLGQSPT